MKYHVRPAECFLILSNAHEQVRNSQANEQYTIADNNVPFIAPLQHASLQHLVC